MKNSQVFYMIILTQFFQNNQSFFNQKPSQVSKLTFFIYKQNYETQRAKNTQPSKSQRRA